MYVYLVFVRGHLDTYSRVCSNVCSIAFCMGKLKSDLPLWNILFTPQFCVGINSGIVFGLRQIKCISFLVADSKFKCFRSQHFYINYFWQLNPPPIFRFYEVLKSDNLRNIFFRPQFSAN